MNTNSNVKNEEKEAFIFIIKVKKIVKNHIIETDFRLDFGRNKYPFLKE